MYKYEEKDFNEILADPEIDPENAEVMYAIAQCYRQGKGVEADAQKYVEMLQNAADAGSEMAKEELASLEGEPEGQAEEGEPEVQKDFTKLPMDELMDLVDEDDIKACCEVYRRYGKEESRYLMHAAELIDQGNHSLSKEECQKVLETLAAYYLNSERDIAKGMEAYGKAAELGSAAACWKLAELCTDEQQKMFYAKKASEVGNDYDIYRYAEILWKGGRRAEADACLAKLLKKADLDEMLKVQIKMHHHTEDEEKEVAQLAWSHVEEPLCKEFLEDYYSTDPAKLSEDQLPTEEQAYKLADLHRGVRWNGNPWYAWMQWAAERGNEKAIAEVQAEDEIRAREREEQERRAEQLRIEQERRREQARMESMKAMGVSGEMVEPEPAKQPSYVPKQPEKKKQFPTKLVVGLVLIGMIIYGLSHMLVANMAKKVLSEAEKSAQQEQVTEVESDEAEEDNTFTLLPKTSSLPQVDPFEELKVNTYGADPYITLDVAYMGNDPMLLNATYTVSQQKNLRNGDSVVISVEVDDSLIKEYQEELTTTTTRYTVDTGEYWTMGDVDPSNEVMKQFEDLAARQAKDYLAGSNYYCNSGYLDNYFHDKVVKADVEPEVVSVYECENSEVSDYKKDGDWVNYYGSETGRIAFVVKCPGTYNDYWKNNPTQELSDVYVVVPVTGRYTDDDEIAEFEFKSMLLSYETQEDAEFALRKQYPISHKVDLPE